MSADDRTTTADAHAEVEGHVAAETTIATTGATGQLGGRVAARLAERQVRQRLIVRDRRRAPDLPGTEVAVADYAQTAEMTASLHGIETLLLVSASEHPDRVGLHRSAIDAAVQAGVERIVYTSFLGAGPDATFVFARDHWHTEEHLRRSGIRWTAIRNSLYLDVVPYLAGEEGVIRGPADDGRIVPVARDDSADVLTQILLTEDDTYDGAILDVTGSDRVTLDELARLLGEVQGREVRYIDETIEEAWASRAHYGAPDWEVRGWVTTYVAIAEGAFDVVSDTVERVAGHPPTPLRTYLERHA